MLTQHAWLHGLLSFVLLLGVFFLLQRRSLWYLAGGLYLINLLMVATYLIVNSMTGDGFNDAALYHLLNARSDMAMLMAFDGFRYGVPALLIGIALLVWVVRKVRLPARIPISVASQTLVVLSTAGFGFYTSPLTADVLSVVQTAGLDQTDRIGLKAVLQHVDRPAPKAAGSKKNLIVVYAESMEQGFFDESRFPALLSQLNALASQGVRFPRLNQAPMSGWTIAGMIATQCGVPLSSHRLHNNTNDFGKFTGAYQCLSQYLGAQGHWRVYMAGADGAFAGKAEYYNAMGFEEVLGLNQLAKPNSPTSKWGLYDDELLPLVRQKISTLRAAEKLPFALLTLTLDTHPPEGYASPSCVGKNERYRNGNMEHLNSIHCTDTLLTEFLKSIIRENLHDSTIVLLSDHLMMGSQGLDALVAADSPRHNQMVIWDKDLPARTIGRAGSQFDVGPTILQALENNSYQLGFGTSLLDERSNLTEQHGQSIFDEAVHAWRTQSWSKW